MQCRDAIESHERYARTLDIANVTELSSYGYFLPFFFELPSHNYHYL